MDYLEGGGSKLLPNGNTCTYIHGVMSQKTVLFNQLIHMAKEADTRMPPKQTVHSNETYQIS